MKKKKWFEYERWNIDGGGTAHVIAKDVCPNAADVPDYICEAAGISEMYKPEMVVREGWCAYQCRSDWEDGRRGGSYIVMEQKNPPLNSMCKKSVVSSQYGL